MDKKTLSRYVRTNAERIIKNKGLTKARVARDNNIPVSTFMGWFNRPTVSLGTICRLSDILGVSPFLLIMTPPDRCVYEEGVEEKCEPK